MSKPKLKLSHDMWYGMRKEDQQETAKKYTVIIGPSYAAADDKEQRRKLDEVKTLEVVK